MRKIFIPIAVLLLFFLLIFVAEKKIDRSPVLVFGRTYADEIVIARLNGIEKQAKSNEYGEYAIMFEVKDIRKMPLGEVNVLEMKCRNNTVKLSGLNLGKIDYQIEVNI